MFGYGLGILLLVIGAILRFAVADRVDGVNLPMIGNILMIAGVLALIMSAIFNAMATSRRRRVVTTEERPVVEERRTYE